MASPSKSLPRLLLLFFGLAEAEDVPHDAEHADDRLGHVYVYVHANVCVHGSAVLW